MSDSRDLGDSGMVANKTLSLLCCPLPFFPLLQWRRVPLYPRGAQGPSRFAHPKSRFF
jgi:hypothetical protein